MEFIIDRLDHLGIPHSYTQLRDHLRTPLYLNAYVLITNQVVSAGLGFLYWMLAARFYSSQVVGRSSAAISTLVFLATLAELSLKAAMVRFVPRAGKATTHLILYTYGVNLLAAALITTLFFLVGQHFEFTAALFSSTNPGFGWVILAAMFWTIFIVQDGVLMGLRQASWVLIENTFFNLSKLILLVIGIGTFYNSGIVGSWFIPVPFAVLLVNGMVFWRFIPFRMNNPEIKSASITVRQVVTSISGDHVGTLLAETGVRLLPLMVLNILGDSANAYFYQTWVVATTLFLICTNMASSFTVEAASDLKNIAIFSRRILRQMAWLIIPLALGIFLFAPLILRLFGPVYSENGTTLLRWLSLAAFPMIFNTWFLSYSRVRGDSRSIILNQGLSCVLTLGLSYIWLAQYGITSIGIAWLVAQTIICIIVIAKTAPILFTRTVYQESDIRQIKINTWRRADWRFLTSTPWPENSVCYANGLLSESIKLISKNVIDNARVSDRECDLVVAINPDHRQLNNAFNALQTGGTLYSEWSSWRKGGAGAIRQRLKVEGFSHIRLYWPYPDQQNPRLWLPLDSSTSASQYTINRVIIGDRPDLKLARAFLTRLLRIILWIGLPPHLCVIASKGEHKPDIYDLAGEQWSRITETATEVPFSILMQTGGQHLNNKIVFLVFWNNASNPQWVIKMPRVPVDVTSIQQENKALDLLEKMDLSSTGSYVFPKMLFRDEFNKTLVSGQLALSGIPLDKILRRNNFQRTAHQITEFQIKLGLQSREQPDQYANNEKIERLVDGLQRLPPEVIDPTILDEIRKILSTLDPKIWVCAHNDFVPWNVLCKGSEMGIIDWADVEFKSFPMLDLIYILTNMVITIEDAWDIPHLLISYKTFLDPTTFLGAIVKENLEYYAHEVGINLDRIPSLRLLTWVIHCNFEINVFTEESGISAPLHSLSKSIPLALLKAEVDWHSDQSSI